MTINEQWRALAWLALWSAVGWMYAAKLYNSNTYLEWGTLDYGKCVEYTTLIHHTPRTRWDSL